MQTPPLQIAEAKGFWRRFKGLMLAPPLAANHALLILRCASVHTFFMRFSVDIVYLDSSGTVVRTVRDMRPWRISWGGFGAAHTLELVTGGINLHGIQIGQAMLQNLEKDSHAIRTPA